MSIETDPAPVPATTTSRLEAFSDGVIAIAITLLILEVKVPEAEPGRLGHELARQWPSYASYAVSFATIGIMWVNHHAMFERIARVDRNLLFLNLMLLMGIGFLPFPTALLADYVQEGGANSHVAAAVYGATMLLIGVAFSALWSYLVRHPRLLVDGFSADGARRALRRSLPSALVYGASIGLAFVSAPACLVLYAAIALYFALTHVAQGT